MRTEPYKYHAEPVRMNPFLIIDQLKKESYITWIPAEKAPSKADAQMFAFKLPYWYQENVVTAWLTKNDHLLDSLSEDQRLNIELEISDLFIN